MENFNFCKIGKHCVIIKFKLKHNRQMQQIKFLFFLTKLYFNFHLSCIRFLCFTDELITKTYFLPQSKYISI
jgi:hypothetical protein